MTGSGDIAPGRLAELVDGAPPRDDDERELAALLAATRALEPGAPEGLRARVGARLRAADRAPAGPLARLREHLAGDPQRRRRVALVGAPVAAALVAAAIAVPVLTSEDASPPPVMREALAPEADEAAPQAPGAGSAVAPPAPRAAQPGPGWQVTSSTRVRVNGADGLARAGARAAASVRGLGGVTVASEVAPSATQRRSLVFRVPVERVEDAIAAFGRLGTVVGQRPGVAELARRLDAAARRRASRATLTLILTAE